jgi:hypothetical protein
MTMPSPHHFPKAWAASVYTSSVLCTLSLIRVPCVRFLSFEPCVRFLSFEYLHIDTCTDISSADTARGARSYHTYHMCDVSAPATPVMSLIQRWISDITGVAGADTCHGSTLWIHRAAGTMCCFNPREEASTTVVTPTARHRGCILARFAIITPNGAHTCLAR